MSVTSATIPRNIESDYPYIEHIYQRRGTLKAVVRILNSEGKSLAEKFITDNYQDTDTVHDGYAPAGLREKQLQLPSEDNIRAQFVKKLFEEARGTSRELVDSYWMKVLTAASSVKDPVERWERLLTIALQVPTIKEQAITDIRQGLSNIPADFVDKIESQFGE
jgi:hypothetical protein